MLDLNKIIESENQERLYQAEQRAKEIIGLILKNNAKVVALNKENTELKAELKGLSVDTINAAEIL